MNSIEAQYRSHCISLSGQQKIVRTLSLFDEIYSMIKRKTLSQHPALSEKDIRKKIAGILYRTDPKAQSLLSLSKK